MGYYCIPTPAKLEKLKKETTPTNDALHKAFVRVQTKLLKTLFTLHLEEAKAIPQLPSFSVLELGSPKTVKELNATFDYHGFDMQLVPGFLGYNLKHVESNGEMPCNISPERQKAIKEIANYSYWTVTFTDLERVVRRNDSKRLPEDVAHDHLVVSMILQRDEAVIKIPKSSKTGKLIAPQLEYHKVDLDGCGWELKETNDYFEIVPKK